MTAAARAPDGIALCAAVRDSGQSAARGAAREMKEASVYSFRPNALTQLLEELDAGNLKIVDLTTPLAPETPVIDLPPIFAGSPGLTLTEISRYDQRGPAWYWNTLHLGEHTGTHFYPPVHWISGRDLPDNTTDTVPPAKVLGAAFVLDCIAQPQQIPELLLSV